MISKEPHSLMMEHYLLGRELGNARAASNLVPYKNTCLLAQSLPACSRHDIIHSTGVNVLAIERQQGRFLISGGSNGTIAIWDLYLNYSIPPIGIAATKDCHQFGVSSIVFYPPDASLFVTSSYDRTVKAWDSNELTVACGFIFDSVVYSVAMSPPAYHTLVAVSSQSPAVRLLDLKSGNATHSLVGHIGGGTLVSNWSPKDPHLLATGGEDGTIRLWDIRQASTCLARLDMHNSNSLPTDSRNQAHAGAVNGITWTDDGSCLISFGHDNKLRVWDLDVGQNTFADFGAIVRNHRRSTTNPVLSSLRETDPCILFVQTESDVLGFSMSDNSLIVKSRISRDEKVNSLIKRPHTTELYTGSTGGTINALVPCAPFQEDPCGDIGALS